MLTKALEFNLYWRGLFYCSLSLLHHEILQKKLRRVHMLDSDEEDEGEGGVAIGEPTAVGGVGEPAGATPTIGDDEELSNDNENFSHVSWWL